MAQYVLLLRDPLNSFDHLSPEELQKTFERYRDWSAKLQAAGTLKSGQKLQRPSGRVMKRSGTKLQVTDGPFVETKEVLGGLFVIEAGSYEQASKMAADCPHLDFGSIEIREIEVSR